MRDPLAKPRYDLVRMKIEVSPRLVFKRGMSTDLTMSHLVEVSKEKPRGWCHVLSVVPVDDDDVAAGWVVESVVEQADDGDCGKATALSASGYSRTALLVMHGSVFNAIVDDCVVGGVPWPS